MINFLHNVWFNIKICYRRWQWNRAFAKRPVSKEKRSPAVKQLFECDYCHKNFEAYPSEVLQVNFARYNDNCKPLLKCEKCWNRQRNMDFVDIKAID